MLKQNLKDQIFGQQGYSADFKLTPNELSLFQSLVNAHWLSTIITFYPELSDEARQLGIHQYHLLAHKLDHQKLWPKARRVLPQASVQQLKQLPFMSKLKEAFGPFSISDIYDTEQRFGQEEIYWRLVRPSVSGDVGPLHKDHWFHGAFNDGYGMFTEGTATVKVWVPIFCEPGKSGLSISPGSHLRSFKHRVDMIDGYARPQLEEDPTTVGAVLIPTEPGNLLMFNENVLHGGVVNQSAFTRVSAEITLVIEEPAYREAIL